MIYVTGFDGKDHKFNYHKNKSRKSRSNKSSYHKEARDLISNLLGNYSVYEEVTLPGSKKLSRASLLYADFYIPELALIIEVHGEQHYNYSHFFHKNKYNFFKSKNRDKDKIEWCEINEIDVVILPYNEREKWTQMITEKR
jgi:hypothetical protein